MFATKNTTPKLDKLNSYIFFTILMLKIVVLGWGEGMSSGATAIVSSGSTSVAGNGAVSSRES